MKSNRRFSLSARLAALVPSLAFVALAGAACGVDGDNRALPIFTGGFDGSTFEASADASAETSSDGEANETSTDANSDSGDGSTSATNLVLSQVQSRGTGGGNDEFVEIYNPTGSDVTFDNTWSVTVRNATGPVASCATVLPSTLLTGASQVIASHKHLLYTTSSYSESTAGDATFSASISDAASLVLVHGGATVDALCFSYDAGSTTTLTTCLTPYTCEGTPATNPHDNTGSSDTDASLERKPGGAGGNGTDTNDSANDFMSNATPDPHDLASAAVP